MNFPSSLNGQMNDLFHRRASIEPTPFTQGDRRSNDAAAKTWFAKRTRVPALGSPASFSSRSTPLRDWALRPSRATAMMSVSIVFFLSGVLYAEIPTVLTDKVSKGSGTIDLLVDVSAQELETYLDSGTLYLGVDLNENAIGNESRDSVGVAIEQMELVITTTEGEVSFSEFYTNTTAMIEKAGATETSEYHTLFGTLGSSSINGSTDSFDISNFDDVIMMENIEVEGEILSAELRVKFLDTSGTGENETFFDYSNGFEDFAIFSEADAAILDGANIGLDAAPSGQISFTQTTAIGAAVGAPSPAVWALAVVPFLLLRRMRTLAR